MPSLGFEPLIPLALWLSLAAAAGSVLAWYAWRRHGSFHRKSWMRMICLMGLGMALVLVLLLNPMVIEPVPQPPGKPLATILLDVSASMTTPDAGAGRTRYQAASQSAAEFARAAGERFDVRVIAFAATARAVALEDLDRREPDGDFTDFAVAIREGLTEEMPQGQVQILLSDGIPTTEGGVAKALAAARAAKALACPIFTQTFGGDREVKDMAVELRSPYEVAFVGQKASVVARLKQRGLQGARTTVTLEHEGKTLQQREIVFTDQETAETTFEITQDRVGQFRYEVHAAPAPGEVSLVNNTASLVLRVVDQPVRVLLLEGKPYWDNKFLMRTLGADPSIALDSVVRVNEGRLYWRTLARPTTQQTPPPQAEAKVESKDQGPMENVEERWKILSSFSEVLAGGGLNAYQVIVLGRDAETFLTDEMLGHLRAWLAKDGGALLCYRGQPVAQLDQRLAQMLPVRWAPTREARFQWNLTERGRDLRWLTASEADALAGLPTLASASLPEQPRALSVVLATAQPPGAAATNPAVIYQPYGLGRVVTIEGSGMWRWAFLPPQQKQFDRVYQGLWHNVMRWLVSNASLLPGQTMALRSDKVRFDPAEPATATLLRRRMAEPVPLPAIELAGDSLEKPRQVTPTAIDDDDGTLRVTFGRLPEGRYLAKVVGGPADATAVFDVRTASEERLNLKARPDLMARLAEDSGGAALGQETPGEAVRMLHDHLQRQRAQQVRRAPLWDRWWVLVGIIALWGGTWGWRRSRGLI